MFGSEPTFEPAGISPFLSLDADVMEAMYQEGLPRFDYDHSAPLRAARESEPAITERSSRFDLSYESPRGGRVPATLVVPREKGPHAAVILQHGLPGKRRDLVAVGRRVAGMGAVVLMIDAPFARPARSLEQGDPITFTPRDAADQEQLIVDLRRAVDLLMSRRDVDPDRIGYLGFSYGGAMGGLLAGVEHRIATFALVVGDGGLVSHTTGRDDVGGPFWRLPQNQRRRWISAMEPIEPLYFVGHATPSSLLFQSGLEDDAVPPVDAVAYQHAGREPKEVRWYEAGHLLTAEAVCDTMLWLNHELSLRARTETGCASA